MSGRAPAGALFVCIIEVYVHRLRKKLEPGGVRIVTVRGLGYSLEKPAP